MEDILRHHVRIAREAINDVIELSSHSAKEDKIFKEFREELLAFCEEIKEVVEDNEEDDDNIDEDEEEMDF